MLPFNESCFRVLHSVMVKKKKAIHNFHCTQLHPSASALLVFSVQESKKGETLKNNQAGTAGAPRPPQCPKTKRFARNAPKRAGGVVCQRVGGGKAERGELGRRNPGQERGRGEGLGVRGAAGLGVRWRRCTRMIFLMIL